MKLLLTSLVLVCTLGHLASCAKVLILVPLASRSETHLFSTLAKALLARGHAISYVSPQSAKINSKNFKEIIPVTPIDINDFQNHEADPVKSRHEAQNMFSFFNDFDMTPLFNRCHKVLNNTEFQNLQKEKFDLIILSSNFNAFLLGMIHKMQTPFMYFSSMPVLPMTLKLTGLRAPSSFVPNPFLPYSDKMSFFERCGNFLFNGFMDYFNDAMNSDFAEISRKYLGDAPKLREIESSVSLIMQNSHFSLNPPRPSLPDVIDVGGMHCREAVPLPKDLDKWLSDAKEGFIYFSLGTVVKGVSLPESTRKVLLNVFSRLKQRVLWKFESEEMSDLSPNVLLKKWLPQQDVLGHKNIRLFISHGGLLSTQESTFHGVPVLGIPFIADQDVNMKQLDALGISKTVEVMNMTEEVLEKAIMEMLTDSKYMKRAKEIQALVRDRPQPPLDIAVYWTEYVIRHKGATHLRSTARQLSNIQYYCLDVVGFILGIVFTTIYIVYRSLAFLCCRRRRQTSAPYTNGHMKKIQ